MRTPSHVVRAATLVIALGSGLVAGCTGLPPSTFTAGAASSARPTPTPVPGITLGLPQVIELSAKNIAFSRQAIDVHANAQFVIRFVNAEANGDVPHTVDIRRMDGVNVIAEQQPISGGRAIDYAYPALAPGNYLFICRVHPIPAMSGTLLVR
jgi:plastocyanin